ncbi:hypothetical protein AG1IA_09117 [Rhizoctonia solani AG-1 IA]|uniref:Uncharacterized protein n=1 Tax=Thanatephorus cucumeris (strain AG1-IA) TaxID=983506 RepID=L8WKI2_THACA|nr:hypothetical protein AG1IA_09117 [Rhizoctonia solani AG-1 IA]
MECPELKHISQQSNLRDNSVRQNKKTNLRPKALGERINPGYFYFDNWYNIFFTAHPRLIDQRIGIISLISHRRPPRKHQLCEHYQNCIVAYYVLDQCESGYELLASKIYHHQPLYSIPTTAKLYTLIQMRCLCFLSHGENAPLFDMPAADEYPPADLNK